MRFDAELLLLMVIPIYAYCYAHWQFHTFNPLVATFHEWRAMFADVRLARGLANKCPFTTPQAPYEESR